MARQVFYFRPGEEARMLARCQFACHDHGACGATLTYPIKGMPWRRNIMKSFEFDLDTDTVQLLLSEVTRIRREYPDQCLSADQQWNDASEKGNAIARERVSGVACHSIVLSRDWNDIEDQYDLREDSEALLTSSLYKVISNLIAPHERR